MSLEVRCHSPLEAQRPPCQLAQHPSGANPTREEEPASGAWPGRFSTHKGRRERPGSPGRPHLWSHSATKRNAFEHGLQAPGVWSALGLRARGGRQGLRARGARRAFGAPAPAAGTPPQWPRKRQRGPARSLSLACPPSRPPGSPGAVGGVASAAAMFQHRQGRLPGAGEREGRPPQTGILACRAGPRSARCPGPGTPCRLREPRSQPPRRLVGGGPGEVAFSSPAGEFPGSLLWDPGRQRVAQGRGMAR